MNKQEMILLKKILISEKASSLFNIKLKQGYQSLILYPTNDFWLTEKQFIVLKEFIKSMGDNEFFFTQFDGGSIQEEINISGIFSEKNPVYKLNLSTEYLEYCKPFLYSVSVLFSVSGTWAIFIDETFDAGYGIFVSSEEYVNKFKKLFEPIKTEYCEWMEDKRYNEDVEYYIKLLKSKGIICKK